MPTLEILKTYSVTELRKEVGKARIKNYSKLKKSEVMDLMMKNKEKFHHLKGKVKAPKAKAVAKPKAVEKPLAKKEPAYLPSDVMKNIKGFMNVGADAKKKEMDADIIMERLEGQSTYIRDTVMDPDQDGWSSLRGMFRSFLRVIKKTMKDKRFTTNNDVVRFWLKHQKELNDYMTDTPKVLAKRALPK